MIQCVPGATKGIDMMALNQIRAINSWAKSEECKKLARRLNTGKHEGRVKDAAVAVAVQKKGN